MKTSLVVTLLTAMTLLTFSPAVGQAPPPCGRGTQGQRFVILESGTSVCDNVSGIVWERTPKIGLRTYQEALASCAAKGSGWQLPGIKDFFTLVDYANANPPLPTGHPFVIANNGEYWTDTPVAGDPSDVWTFVLDRGRTFAGSIEGTVDYVWCVR
jgi:Protein of unknown function (DUF1566)